MDISRKLLEEIEKNKLQPRPRWHFLLKNWMIVVLFVLSVALGSFSFMLIVERINSGDWEVINHLGKNYFQYFIFLIPYLWLFLLSFFLLVSFYYWKHTKHGYRYRAYNVFLLSFFASGFVGVCLVRLGVGEKIEAYLVSAVPVYGKIKQEAEAQIWMQPESGLIYGVIEDNSNPDEIIVEDPSGEQWRVAPKTEESKRIIKKDKGVAVKVVGRRIDGNNFEAEKISDHGKCECDENENDEIVNGKLEEKAEKFFKDDPESQRDAKNDD